MIFSLFSKSNVTLIWPFFCIVFPAVILKVQLLTSTSCLLLQADEASGEHGTSVVESLRSLQDRGSCDWWRLETAAEAPPPPRPDVTQLRFIFIRFGLSTARRPLVRVTLRGAALIDHWLLPQRGNAPISDNILRCCICCLFVHFNNSYKIKNVKELYFLFWVAVRNLIFQTRIEMFAQQNVKSISTNVLKSTGVQQVHLSMN